MRRRDVLVALIVAGSLAGAEAIAEAPAPCTEDAVLVFDASGSMAGTDMNTVTPHIAKVRDALAAVLPNVAPVRNLGLMIYGPGAGPKCDNIELRLKPAANAAERIMGEVNAVIPAGQTPLTASVRQAAEALKYRDTAAEIVLLTDGEETCGGDPCVLAKALKGAAKNLTIHVIGYRVRNLPAFDSPFTSRCLADETGGLYLQAESKDELIAALQKTLGCPFTTRLPTSPEHDRKDGHICPRRA